MNKELLETLLASSVIFAVLGPIVEIIYTGCEARFKHGDKRWIERFKHGDKRWMGHVSVKMIPAYALLGFSFPLICAFISANPFYVRGLIYAPITHILEFCLGAYFFWRTGEYLWRYDDALNIGHHTTLKLFPVFFAVSLIFEWLVLHVGVVLK